MRVTEPSKHQQVVTNIQKNEHQMKQIQQELASGKQINRLSDNPIGSTIILDITTAMSRGNQIQQNTDSNLNWLERNSVELNHIADLLDRVRTLMLGQMNDTATEESRSVVAGELQAIQQALFDAGNSKLGKLYLFSGTKTLTQPLQQHNPIQEAQTFITWDNSTKNHQALFHSSSKVLEKKTDVELGGQLKVLDLPKYLEIDQIQARFEGHSTNEYRVKISRPGSFGNARYQVSDDGGLTWSREEALLPVIKVANLKGKPSDQVLLKFTDDQGLIADLLGMDSGGFFDFSSNQKGVYFPQGLEFSFVPNPKVSYQGSEHKKEVLLNSNTTVPLSITAEEIFFEQGDQSINMFDVMEALQKSLELDDRDAISDRLQDIDHARNQVLDLIAQVGNTMIALQDSKKKISEQEFSYQTRRSEIQDIHMPTTLVEMNTVETNRQASLNAGKRLLQPSLLDFLR